MFSDPSIIFQLENHLHTQHTLLDSPPIHEIMETCFYCLQEIVLQPYSSPVN